ncbi:MAG: anthranilate phosphoribosyltransferase [Acidobacteriota bacterium]
MLRKYLSRLIQREDLSEAEAAGLFDLLLAAETTDPLIAAILVALAAKGETEEELAGFARAMRSRSARIVTTHRTFIDTCGTGGSPAKTFNVSTAAAFVVAAAGVPVAKHGNVGVTSRAGSADVLRALGVDTDLTPAAVAAIFDRVGVCFMFAPLHHQATKRVGMVRRELGVRTIFNLLGPLTNPAGAPYQLIGVSDGTAIERVARALQRLGIRRAWVVRGEDGLDEISLAAPTTVYEIGAELSDGARHFTLEPEAFGVVRRPTGHLRGESAEENAATIRSVLVNERHDEARDLVLINAAAALYVAGVAGSLPAALDLARQALESGEAARRLDALRDASRAVSD